MKRPARRTVAGLLVAAASLFIIVSCGQMNRDWRTANRDSAGIAPLPGEHPGAVVQVYAARAFNWRGIFAVHTWLATKKHLASDYTVYHVMGWRARRNLPVVATGRDIPDRHWFDSRPSVVADIRGPAAEKAIEKIDRAVREYPYQDNYGLWPGPNSNTFTAYVARRVPDLRAALPSIAIGKDFLAHGALLGRSPSGTGFQFSLLGALGLTLAVEEGLEINLLGLVFGIDIVRPALKLPFVGRIGVSRDASG